MAFLTQEQVQELAPDTLSNDPAATLARSCHCMQETGSWSPNQQMADAGQRLCCPGDYATMQSGLQLVLSL